MISEWIWIPKTITYSRVPPKTDCIAIPTINCGEIMTEYTPIISFNRKRTRTRARMRFLEELRDSRPPVLVCAAEWIAPDLDQEKLLFWSRRWLADMSNISYHRTSPNDSPPF